MTILNNGDDDFLLTFADLVNIAKKNKRKIWFGALLFALLGLFYSATKPIEYHATATFKEKGKTHSGLGKSISALFLGGESGDSDALTMMKSRKLVEQLVKDTGMQVIIGKKETRFPFPSWQAIKENLTVEYALFKNMTTPFLPDPIVDIIAERVNYEEEGPLTLRIAILSSESFALYNGQNQKIGEGVFGFPFISDRFSLTLKRNSPHLAKEYSLTLLPLGTTAEAVGTKFKIEPDLADKGLIKISYKHRDRLQASSHIKTFMQIYQNYIRNEHERINEIQIDYLHKRQKEMGKQLHEDLQAYAQKLSTDMSTTGFATSAKAMDFLASNHQQLKQKLLTLSLEIQRLENIHQDNSADCEKLVYIPNFDAINKSILEMHSLKQQADSLNLALRTNSASPTAFQESFNSQLVELDEIQECAKEARLMYESLENNALPTPYPRLINNPRFIVKTWYDQLLTSRNSNDQTTWQKNKTGFVSYLSHLIHYLGVHQRNMEERLAHQQAPMKEFQGINLLAANELYMNYSKELSTAESLTIQQRFIIGQINDPNFEISSLSNTLNDPVSADIISKTSLLLLSLKDQDNLSTKEQDRLKIDLALQKGFLTTHLQQNVVLLELRQKFLKEKIQNLQTINLSLIYEQISILENQIKNYLASAIENLKREQKLLQDSLTELHVDMSGLPKKWAAERMIGQEMAINRHMIEEITKLLESKSINDNLEKIQSAPVDLPLTPIHPKSPRLLLFAFLGAIAGAFLSFAYVLARSVSKGVETSTESLRVAGQHVSGALSRNYNSSTEKGPILDSDLETLRRLASYILEPSKTPISKSGKGNTILLLENDGPNFAENLALLMSKKGLNILVADLCFDDPKKAGEAGLLQYLEGGPEVKIAHAKSFDTVSSGGICRYANELLGSQKFKDLFHAWQQQYDWVIAYSHVPPESAAAESLLSQFSNVSITLSGESLNQLRSCMRLASHNGIKLSFIITNK